MWQIKDDQIKKKSFLTVNRHSFYKMYFVSRFVSNIIIILLVMFGHYSFSRSEYLHLLLAPIRGFISLINNEIDRKIDVTTIKSLLVQNRQQSHDWTLIGSGANGIGILVCGGTHRNYLPKVSVLKCQLFSFQRDAINLSRLTYFIIC